MAERELWNDLKDKLSAYGKLKRVENSCDKGTPDVSYLIRRYARVDPTAGWLELKWEPGWPAKGPLKIHSLTKDQVLWQEDWFAGGGKVFTLIRIGKEHLLVDPPLLRRVYERDIDAHTLRGLATGWDGPYHPTELIRCIT